MSLLKHNRSGERIKERERAFDLSTSRFSIPQYNALVDRNMCHYFESRNLQSHLLKTGQIDLTGRVVEHDKTRFKLTVLEKEFKRADAEEAKQRAEEEEMRYRIQRKRIAELEKTRKEVLISKLRKEKEFAKIILQTSRPSTSVSPLSERKGTSDRHSSYETL